MTTQPQSQPDPTPDKAPPIMRPVPTTHKKQKLVVRVPYALSGNGLLKYFQDSGEPGIPMDLVLDLANLALDKVARSFAGLLLRDEAISKEEAETQLASCTISEMLDRTKLRIPRPADPAAKPEPRESRAARDARTLRTAIDSGIITPEQASDWAQRLGISITASPQIPEVTTPQNPETVPTRPPEPVLPPSTSTASPQPSPTVPAPGQRPIAPPPTPPMPSGPYPSTPQPGTAQQLGHTPAQPGPGLPGVPPPTPAPQASQPNTPNPTQEWPPRSGRQ